uniref:Immunoglobulin domain-containing protein n=1 Tax=Oryzias melastigma TaxID=30732 RepID=A0A3B3BHD3_ORYME
MMHHLSVCLFLSFLSVQVVRGASISIPCLYDSKYEKHVKYLCKGHYWRSCSYAVKTNKLDTNGNFLIQDVKEQKTFTVTINHVDTDSYYWCVVEIDGGADDREFFHLSVSSTPALRVDRQKMEGFRGGNITINCYSRSSGMRKWCKLGGNCVTSSFQLVDGRKVIINKNHSVYSVTMIGLKQENSGWYWCDQGQFQMPVHLTVTERPATYFVNVFSRTDPTILFISLGVLIVIVLVACLVWFVLKGSKSNSNYFFLISP